MTHYRSKTHTSKISQIFSEVFGYLYLWCKWMSNQLDLVFASEVKITSCKYGVSPLIHLKFSNTAKLVMRKWRDTKPGTVHYSQAQGRQYSHKQQMDSVEESFHFCVCGNLHSWVLILIKVLLTTATNIKFKIILQNSLGLWKFSKHAFPALTPETFSRSLTLHPPPSEQVGGWCEQLELTDLLGARAEAAVVAMDAAGAAQAVARVLAVDAAPVKVVPVGIPVRLRVIVKAAGETGIVPPIVLVSVTPDGHTQQSQLTQPEGAQERWTSLQKGS